MSFKQHFVKIKASTFMMNNQIAVMLFIFVSFFSCVKGQNNDSYDALLHSLLKKTVPQIEADSLFRYLAANPNAYLLDARELNEYHTSHLPNAEHVGYNNFKMPEHIDSTGVYIVYCSVGYRSEKIGEKLIANGCTKVYNLKGGIFSWANKGYPMVNNTAVTKSVHGYSKKWGVWLKNQNNVIYD